MVSMNQRDPWVLHRLRELFGGSVSKVKGRNLYGWTIYGALADGFLMTIYSWLSPWRRRQAAHALGRT